MTAIRTVVRGDRRYYYLVQTYRWGGEVGRKEKYLGTTRPADLRAQRARLERQVWDVTWFRSFNEVFLAYQERQRSLPESLTEKEREDFVIEFTYDTNRIEGSTLTFRETSDLLTHGVSPASKPIRDIQETLAHAALLRRLLLKPEPVNLPHLLTWHRSIFGETKPDISGRVRDFEVRISGSQQVPPFALEVRPMLVETLRWFQRHGTTLDPVERAGLFHFQFENIHPFGDGNGRIGRLAMNLMLFQDKFPMINIRYGRRTGYYRALERSSIASSPRPFLLWFFRRYLAEQQWWLRPRKRDWSK
ncbi:MAG: Fic family protein [Thermoplasmata archaeon]